VGVQTELCYRIWVIQ